MASISGFVIGSALASDLDAPERMRLGLVGALMPSPLVGALIVESLVESDEKAAAEDARGGAGLAIAAGTPAGAGSPRPGASTPGRGGTNGGTASSPPAEPAAALPEGVRDVFIAQAQRIQLLHGEERLVEGDEEALFERAFHAAEQGGFLDAAVDVAENDLEELQRRRERIAEELRDAFREVLRAAKASATQQGSTPPPAESQGQAN
jgi:hypothetical protein